MGLFKDFLKGDNDEDNGSGDSNVVDTNFVYWFCESEDYFEVISNYDQYLLDTFKGAYELMKDSKPLLGDDDD